MPVYRVIVLAGFSAVSIAASLLFGVWAVLAGDCAIGTVVAIWYGVFVVTQEEIEDAAHYISTVVHPLVRWHPSHLVARILLTVYNGMDWPVFLFHRYIWKKIR